MRILSLILLTSLFVPVSSFSMDQDKKSFIFGCLGAACVIGTMKLSDYLNKCRKVNETYEGRLAAVEGKFPANLPKGIKGLQEDIDVINKGETARNLRIQKLEEKLKKIKTPPASAHASDDDEGSPDNAGN